MCGVPFGPPRGSMFPDATLAMMGRISLPFIAAMALVLTSGADAAQGDFSVRELGPGIYYGAAPETPADYCRLRSLGVKTIVELRKFQPRAIARERRLAGQYGLAWRHVPMGFHPLRDGSPECVLRIIAGSAHQPAYFHCNLGKDRAGLIVALYRVRFLGWAPGDAFAEMKRQQFNPKLQGLDDYFWRRWRCGSCRIDASTTARDESKALTAAAGESPALAPATLPDNVRQGQ